MRMNVIVARTFLALHSSVLEVSAVVGGVKRTAKQRGLRANTHEVIKDDRTSSLTKESERPSNGTRWREAELPAGHLCVLGSPEIVTHRTPDCVCTDFDSALSLVQSVDHSDVSVDALYIEGK